MIDENAVLQEIMEYTNLTHNIAVDINNGDLDIHKIYAHKHASNLVNILETLRNESVLLKTELLAIEAE